jgi:predicted dehydrogenase
MIRVGVIGYGYWGPVVARNLQGADGCELVAICDTSQPAADRARKAYPGILVTNDPCELIRSPHIDAIAVITPVWAHFEFAKAALENGKHVFVEKPFTASSEEASQLIDLAAARKLQIMVDHTFLFTGAVRKIRQLIDGGVLGKLFYYDSSRVNLGLFQHDVNVIWDLAPHDLAIMDYLIDAEPESVSATGQCHLNG